MLISFWFSLKSFSTDRHTDKLFASLIKGMIYFLLNNTGDICKSKALKLEGKTNKQKLLYSIRTLYAEY